jgi:transposase-like protein
MPRQIGCANAHCYDRSEARRDTRAGHYDCALQTKADDVRLKIPKLRQQTFETAITERYRRRESSVEKTLVEMYLAMSDPGAIHVTRPFRC